MRTVGLETMTSDEASRALGVSVRQVQRLVAAGELVGAGRVGRSLLVDAGSVNRLRANGAHRGRPWNQRTAWAALELLSGELPSELTSSQRWHLRKRLQGLDPDELVRVARRRAELRRYRVSESFLSRLADDLVLTGHAALSVDKSLAAEFGLASARSTGIDGYAQRADVDRLADDYRMVEDTSGNVVLRTVNQEIRLAEAGHAGLAAVALDLAESLDPRERAAGRRVLHRMLKSL